MTHNISVIIPVLNEAAVIQQTIDHVFGLTRQGELEIIVVDGSPDCGTIRTIRNNDVRRTTAGQGRSRQMNKGASAAAHEILLFLHADTSLPEDALIRISDVTADSGIVGGAFSLGIRSGRPAFRIIEKAATFRSRVTRVPYGDQAIFLRRDYFRALGGFSEIPLMEDVELMRRIRKAGGRIEIIPAEVKTSPRRWEKEGIVYCTLRNWALITLYSLGVTPERLARFYR